ncbi:MAG: hypothetical protein FWH37_02225, partial [Candidatus Bathyarchaeota archaeon]|nr:hypothetical protein [Candidatus Termiticorpusculum sp.]
NPNDDALYATNIKCTFWTDPFTQGYNNYDISYTKNTPITYTVSIADSFASTTGSGNYVPEVTVTINAGNREGYTFTRWSVTAGSVTLSNINSATATFTMPDRNVAITAIWNPTSGGSESGGGSKGGGSEGSPSKPSPNTSTSNNPAPSRTTHATPTNPEIIVEPKHWPLLLIVTIVLVIALLVVLAVFALKKSGAVKTQVKNYVAYNDTINVYT